MESWRRQEVTTLQLRYIKRCQWNRGWYVQLTEWIKPITTSKLKFKWMLFSPKSSIILSQTVVEWSAVDNTLFLSLVFHKDAKTCQGKAPESPLLVPLLLQVLQEQGLRFLLQVLRVTCDNYQILIYCFTFLYLSFHCIYITHTFTSNMIHAAEQRN